MMKLKAHGRYRYSPISGRPHYRWPGGKRLAFYVAVNVEHFRFGKGLGHTPSYATPQPDVRNFAWRDYGLRVGIWRLFDLFDELQVPACLLANSAVYDSAHVWVTRPSEIAAHVARLPRGIVPGSET